MSGSAEEDREMYGEFAEREKMIWFWLAHACGLCAGEMHRIRDRLPVPEEITQMSAAGISEICEFSARRSAMIVSAVKDLERSKEVCLRMAEQGVSVLSFYDEGFPDRLRLIPDPPFLLFVKGTLPAAEEPSVAIVGSRNCTDYGRSCTEEIAGELAGVGCHIISGLAYGIDGCAHRGALAAGGKTTAVMGCGIDQCYPPRNYGLYRGLLESGGAVVSEYAPGAEALAWHFPVRNRLISGLSDCVLVMEAKEKSGTQITVSYALDQGKDVFALPGRLGDPESAGCIDMIRDGAQILTGAEQVLEALMPKGFSFRERSETGLEKFALDNVERRVYSALSNDPLCLDELLERTALTGPALHKALVSLELEGLLYRSAQGEYFRKRHT